MTSLRGQRPVRNRCLPAGIRGRYVAFATLLSICVWRSAWAQPAADGAAAAATPKLEPALCQIETRPSVEAAGDKAGKKKARGHLLAAKKAYDAYDFSQALRELRSAYELDPQTDILFNIAQTCREGGIDGEALKLYTFILRQNPDPALKADSERHQAALRVKVAKALDERALEQLKGEHYEQAATAWEDAHKLDPQPLYLFRRANALRLLGNVPEALLAYDRFVAANPPEDMLKEARGHMARLRSKQSAERARNHFKAEEYTQAMAAWQAAYEQDAQVLYIYEIAESARLAGLSKESLASYQRFLRETVATEYLEQRKQAEVQSVALRQEIESKKKAERPVYKRWWFWTAIGAGVAVVVGAGIVGAVASQPTNFIGDLPADRQRDLNP